jgi:hypothetical protein
MGSEKNFLRKEPLLMNHHYNPYHVHGGVFVPHYLLSSGEISHGAKLVYALLAQGADRRGEALLNVQLLAAEMGEKEEQVFRFMNELDVARLVAPSSSAASSPARLGSKREGNRARLNP